jgi:hypothetical protein
MPAPAKALRWTPQGEASGSGTLTAAPDALIQPAARPSGDPLWRPGEAPPAIARRSFDLRELEERFAGRALAWIGGVALVAAAIFFLSLAFSRGWITEPMRVVIGLVGGSAALALGTLSFDRRNPLLGNVLTAVGLGVVSIALFAATRGYGLVTPELGLLGALIAAIASAVIAVRFDSREAAAFGLVAALIAPPVMGASPTTLTLLFIAVTLIGTTAIALFRSWRWLPSIAFVLTAPQLASWLLGHADLAQALVALVGFWLVNVIAAGGEEVRIRRDDLRPSSATLVLANAAFLTWGGYTVLGPEHHAWLGVFIALSAAAHLAVGLAFLLRQGDEHLFGNLVAGTGAALLALAAFEQLGAALVPVAWAAEGAALAWLAIRRMHRWSALGAVVLGTLSVAHLLIVEFPLGGLLLRSSEIVASPWLNPEIASLAAVLAAGAFAAWVVRAQAVRSILVAAGTLLLGYAAVFNASGVQLVAVLVVLAVLATELDTLTERLGTRPELEPLKGWIRSGAYATAAALLLGLGAVSTFVGAHYPVDRLGDAVPAVPYADAGALSLAILLAGLALVATRQGTRGIRSAMAGVGVLLVAWTVPFELAGTSRIAMLAALLPVAVLLDRFIARWPDARRFTRVAIPAAAGGIASAVGAIPWAAALADAVAGPLNPSGWGRVTPPLIPFSNEAALVAVILAGAAVAAAAWVVSNEARHVTLLASLVPMALVVPLEVYADAVVVGWLLLGAIALVVTRPGDALRRGSQGVAAVLGAGAIAVAFAIVAPPDRLWVIDPLVRSRPALLAGWWIALAAVAAVPLIASRRPAFVQERSALEVLAAALGVYLVSVGVVDVFQRAVGGTIPVEELAKQAQVGLSVTWTAIGALALAVGLRTRHVMPRHIGFGLLALATAKVFIVDLAAMDVAYRALVLAGLGVLLLASAWLVSNLRGPRAGTHGPRPAG